MIARATITAERPVNVAWVPPPVGLAAIQKVAPGTFTISTCRCRGSVLEFDVPGTGGKSFFVENRDPIGSDVSNAFELDVTCRTPVWQSGMLMNASATSPDWPLQSPGRSE